MKWKLPPRPEHGTLRTVKLYAWWPTRIDVDTVVWLEPYYETQKFYRAYERGMDMDMYNVDTWKFVSATTTPPKGK